MPSDSPKFKNFTPGIYTIIFIEDSPYMALLFLKNQYHMKTQKFLNGDGKWSRYFCT